MVPSIIITRQGDGLIEGGNHFCASEAYLDELSLASTNQQKNRGQGTLIVKKDSRAATETQVSKDVTPRRLGLRLWRAPIRTPLRLFRWLQGRVEHTCGFIRQQIHLMTTGENPGQLVIAFSPIVAASSLAYLAPAVAFWFTKSAAMAGLFTVITITSLQADSLNTKSKIWSCADRAVATVAVFTGPLRTALHEASLFEFRVKVALIACSALAVLGWSRCSKTQAHFVLRHTAWHLMSAAGLTWMALRGHELRLLHEAGKVAAGEMALLGAGLEAAEVVASAVGI